MAPAIQPIVERILDLVFGRSAPPPADSTPRAASVIGSLGDVVFTVSAGLVRTFGDASHTSSARWTAHEVIGQRPVQEFIGPGLRTLSLAVRLDEGLGVAPEVEAAALRDAVEQGEVLPLLLGGEPRGDWVCTEVAETWRRVAADGRIGVIDLRLSLEEYR